MKFIFFEKIYGYGRKILFKRREFLIDTVSWFDFLSGSNTGTVWQNCAAFKYYFWFVFFNEQFCLGCSPFCIYSFCLGKISQFFYLDRHNGSLFKLLSSFKMEKKFTIFVLRLIFYVTADFALCPTVCTFYIFCVFVNKKYIFKMSWAEPEY